MSDTEPSLGAELTPAGARFSVWSGSATTVFLCLFDEAGTETGRVEMMRRDAGVFSTTLPGVAEGQRYGFRADGPYDPANGLWFDPAKLLVDPHALAVDRPYRTDHRLAATRDQHVDTAGIMPKCLVVAPPSAPTRRALFRPGGLVYEVNVRSFTMRHPDVPRELRGTIAALAHPVIIEHLSRLGVDAVELMPVTAWMDERHLPPLGLANAWGYNPVSFMALDPRLAPGGWAELNQAVAALHQAGIGVILDLVFNHTAESDALGPTLSLRGLDARAYYRHGPDGALVNDTGTGNTVACDHPRVAQLVLESLRAFVRYAGVDGFRFDLAPVLGRGAHGFSADAPLLRAIASDPVLADRVMIAEPWDIGPGGYQLGAFGASFLEWNDRYRDDVRRFWRGDAGHIGSLATRLSGSSDVFGEGNASHSRSVNFLAAHDGMTLADLTAYETRHNHANGEDNRDGHGENLSWNHGHEGETRDTAILALRRHDLRALLSTLFASRGTIMLTAGDEFGRTQQGNNNAYAQDNAITWLDWEARDRDLEGWCAALSALRRAHPALAATSFLREADVAWLAENGAPLATSDWEDPSRRRLQMILGGAGAAGRLAVLVNGDRRRSLFTLPDSQAGWKQAGPLPDGCALNGKSYELPGRCVAFAAEARGDGR